MSLKDILSGVLSALLFGRSKLFMQIKKNSIMGNIHVKKYKI